MGARRCLLTATLTAFVVLLTAALARGAADAPAASPAANPPDAVTVADVLHLLRDESPRLAAERPQIDAARGDLVTARLLPNPTLSYDGGTLVDGANVNGVWQHEATLAAPLPITGVRGARVAAAEKQVDLAESQVRARYAELALEARKLFVSLLAAEQREQVLEDAHRDADRLRDIVTGRARAGVAREYDGLRVATEAELIESKAANARAEALDRAGELGKLLGLPNWHPRAVGTLQPLGAKVDAYADPKVMEETRASLVVAKNEEQAAAAAVEVARRERWPQPVLNLGVAETRHDTSTSLVGGLAVELPLFDRGQGKIQRSLAEAEAATGARRVAVAEAGAELGRATRVLEERRAALAAFDRDVVDRLPTLRRMAEDAYRMGQGGIVELLDAAQARTEAELAGIELVASVVEAEVDLLGAAGAVDSLIS
jgi:cobalt-zinc-cadmium efflux system outer membrane protein